MAPVVINRPILSIQPDWEEVFSEPNGTVWVTCKEYLKNGKHGKLKSTMSGGDSPVVIATEGFKVNNVKKKMVTVTHEDPNCKCTFIAPEDKFASIHAKSVVSMDVTCNSLGVSVCSENKLRIWSSANGYVLRELSGHIWDIYTCRFFPSGSVVLSAAADMQVKIWSAETGICPVSLTGHTAAITDTAIVDRGRNIVTVSKDGTARLWDCGQASCLSVIAQDLGSINCCALSNVDLELPQPDEPPSEREVNTNGKLLLVGTEDQVIHGIGLQSRKPVFVYTNESAINCCCFLTTSKFIFGAQNGKIHLFEVADLSEPSMTWEDSASAVLCLLPLKNGFFVGRADGTCIYVPLEGDLAYELTGPDFDPVYCIAHDKHCVYTGSRDGIIRKYNISNSTGILLS